MKEVKFISYKDENNKLIEGHFEILETNETFIKFKTTKNILTIPWSRILRIKEKVTDL